MQSTSIDWQVEAYSSPFTRDDHAQRLMQFLEAHGEPRSMRSARQAIEFPAIVVE